MTDFEFNDGLKRFIIMCENKSINEKDLGNFFSNIYGIGGNTIRIRLFLPAVLKICEMIYVKCTKIEGVYSWDKHYYTSKLYELKKDKLEKYKLLNDFENQSKPNPEFMIELINYLLEEETTNDKAMAYRVVFTGLKTDIEQGKLVFSDDELEFMKSTFEEMLRI